MNDTTTMLEGTGQGTGPAASLNARPSLYAWAVFALTFGLMMSDYVSRQMVGAVFPALKAEWALSDSQLGRLVSAVSRPPATV